MTSQGILILSILAVCVFILGALVGDIVDKPPLVRRLVAIAGLIALGALVIQPVTSYFGATTTIRELVKDYQILISAIVALVAAMIAYSANSQRLAFDRHARREDQRSKIDAVADEAIMRIESIHTVMETSLRALKVMDENGSVIGAKASLDITEPFVKQAIERQTALWEALEDTPAQLRTHAIRLLLELELVVIRAADLVENYKIWTSFDQAKATQHGLKAQAIKSTQLCCDSVGGNLERCLELRRSLQSALTETVAP